MKLNSIQIGYRSGNEVIVILNNHPWLLQITSSGFDSPVNLKRVQGPWKINFPKGLPEEWRPLVLDEINNKIPWE